MNILRNLKEGTGAHLSPVLAIGSFDGIHCGHRMILDSVVRSARRTRGTAAVLTFDPHPQKIIAPADCPRLIQTFEQKAAMMERIGIDLLAVVPFTWELAQLTPRQFVTEIVHETLAVRELHIGSNFRFGHKRAGDVTLLKKLGEELGIQVFEIPEYYVRRQKVSSTKIRRFLSSGRVEFARRMLGRPFEITGAVVRGAGLGARIGIPTANLEVRNELIPQTGVYITRASIGGRRCHGVTNVGFRPTLGATQDCPVVETHFLDFNHDLYGHDLELAFCCRIRAEKKFTSVDELAGRIRKDIALARRYFKRADAIAGRQSSVISHS